MLIAIDLLLMIQCLEEKTYEKLGNTDLTGDGGGRE